MPPFRLLPVEERRPASQQNGTIYNQSQKSHSSAQPGVTSSVSLYCCGTRETLNQLLFDDFLNAASASVCFHMQASPQSHLHPFAFSSFSICGMSPPWFTHSQKKHTQKKTHRCLLSESFRMDDWECFTFNRQLKVRKWIAVSPVGIRCVWAARGEWQPVEDGAELRLNLWRHWSGVLISFFPSHHTGRGGQVWRWRDRSNPWQMSLILPFLVWPCVKKKKGSASCHCQH